MAEMLWAVLISSVFNRPAFLGCLRTIVSVAAPWFKTAEGKATTKQPADGFTDTMVLDHTAFARLDDQQFQIIVDIIRRHPLGPAALRPLLLIDSLPSLERWRRVLGMETTPQDWQTLSIAVSKVLDHQSEASTDVRWFKLVFRIKAGGLFFNEGMEERVREYLQYPDRGEIASVQASVRAAEMMLRRRPPSPWVKDFWVQASSAEPCIDPSAAHDYEERETEIEQQSIAMARLAVITRFFKNRGSERVDARLDASFGLVLYALSVADEFVESSLQSKITGRLALRSLLEAAITHGYLLQAESPEKWAAYRNYGNSQAKLAFLKAQELEDELPTFINEEALYSIVNEDVWQEFLDINLGDWEKQDNRKRSEAAGLKGLYDRYYGWASAFVHANWGAVRDSNLVTCHNPLHRLHRIPRLLHRTLESADADVLEMVNGMIERLDRAYPDVESLPRLAMIPASLESD